MILRTRLQGTHLIWCLLNREHKLFLLWSLCKNQCIEVKTGREYLWMKIIGWNCESMNNSFYFMKIIIFNFTVKVITRNTFLTCVLNWSHVNGPRSWVAFLGFIVHLSVFSSFPVASNIPHVNWSLISPLCVTLL